jgi:hypothetical protein
MPITKASFHVVDAAYSADLPSSKPSSAASTLWSLALVLGDDWEAASMAATN